MNEDERRIAVIWRGNEGRKCLAYLVVNGNDVVGHTGAVGVHGAGGKQRLHAPPEKKLEAAQERSRAFEFGRNHARLLREGRVPEHIAYHRLAVCTGITVEGVKVSEPCAAYRDENGGWGSGHCRACGCPNWPISQMHREGKTATPGKVWFPMGCPRGHYSEHPGRRATATKPEPPSNRTVREGAIA